MVMRTSSRERCQKFLSALLTVALFVASLPQPPPLLAASNQASAPTIASDERDQRALESAFQPAHLAGPPAPAARASDASADLGTSLPSSVAPLTTAPDDRPASKLNLANASSFAPPSPFSIASVSIADHLVVADNPNTQEALVVWTQGSTWQRDVHARLVSSSGATISGTIDIAIDVEDDFELDRGL